MSFIQQGWQQTKEAQLFFEESGYGHDNTFNHVRGVLEKTNDHFARQIQQFKIRQRESDFWWKVLLRGSVSSGKTSLVMSICRREVPQFHSDTPGTMVVDTTCPLKLCTRPNTTAAVPKEHRQDEESNRRRKRQSPTPAAAATATITAASNNEQQQSAATSPDQDDVLWVTFEFCDIGAEAKRKYPHLRTTYSGGSGRGGGGGGNKERADFDAQILVFSMTDRGSFEEITEIINNTPQDELIPTVVVGTKYDALNAYQITEDDLLQLSQSSAMPICLVNNHSGFSEPDGSGAVVEMLADTILRWKNREAAGVAATATSDAGGAGE